VGAELVAAATYTRFWFPQMPAPLLAAGFGAALLLVNLRPVGDYGRFEYWFSMLKVVTIVAFIVIGAALLLGGRLQPQFTANGGFVPNGWLSPVLVLGFAIYTFGGVEMVAISSGEARSAGEIPRATRLMFTVLAIVYLGAITVLVGVMPWQSAGVAQSPFVTVFEVAGLRKASSLVNFVVLTAALSGANASLYVAARMLFSLARDGFAPAGLGRLTRAGSPLVALVASSFGIVMAIVAARMVPEQAFLLILGAALFGGMVAWLVALASHVSFRRRMSPAELAALPIRSPAGVAGSVLGFAGMVAGLAATWWTELRITMISAPVLLSALTLAYWAVSRAKARSTMGP
jgi:L-asparagine transporter-like permease